MSNIRTIMVFPSGNVLSMREGNRMDFPTLDEALTYMNSNQEAVQQIGIENSVMVDSNALDLITQFDHIINTSGLQAGFDFLTNHWNAQAPADQQLAPSVIYNAPNPGADVPVTSTGTVLDLAGMNPVLVGGLIVGALYFLYKRKAS